MNVVGKAALGLALLGSLGSSQTTIEVTGTPVPPDLLKASYGTLPKSLGAFDVDICNLIEVRQNVLSSEVYRSLASSNPDLEPIGSETVLAVILRRHGRKTPRLLTTSLTVLTGVLSVVSAIKFGLPMNWTSSMALASVSGQQLLTSLKPPAKTADEINKLESRMLEPSFTLDGGACEQRTLFAVLSAHAKATPLSFHVR